MTTDDSRKTVDLGEGLKMNFAKDGKLERGAAFQPVKPANIVAPAKLPIPPVPATAPGSNKK
jgi:hypothetical protein